MLRHLKPLAAALNAAAIIAIIAKAVWHLELSDLLWIVLTPVFVAAVTMTARRVRLSIAEVLIHGSLHLAILPIALTQCWRADGLTVVMAGLAALASALNVAVLTRHCLRLRLWRWNRKLAVKR